MMTMKSMKLGWGGRFQKIQQTVANNYEKKGMSPEKAEMIGAAVSAKQGVAKYGKRKMQQMARKGRLR